MRTEKESSMVNVLSSHEEKTKQGLRCGILHDTWDTFSQRKGLRRSPRQYISEHVIFDLQYTCTIVINHIITTQRHKDNPSNSAIIKKTVS